MLWKKRLIEAKLPQCPSWLTTSIAAEEEGYSCTAPQQSKTAALHNKAITVKLQTLSTAGKELTVPAEKICPNIFIKQTISTFCSSLNCCREPWLDTNIQVDCNATHFSHTLSVEERNYIFAGCHWSTT